MTVDEPRHQDPRERLSALSRALSLQDESQDWGIINADPERLDEFVRFLVDREDVTREEAFELVGLILASANEVLLVDIDADLDHVWRAVDVYPEASAIHGDYWMSLADDGRYPVGGRLRART